MERPARGTRIVTNSQAAKQPSRQGPARFVGQAARTVPGRGSVFPSPVMASSSLPQQGREGPSSCRRHFSTANKNQP